FSLGSTAMSMASWLAEDAAHRLPIRELGITSMRWSNAGLGWQLVLYRDRDGKLSRLVRTRRAHRVNMPPPEPLDQPFHALVRVPAGVLRTIEIRPSRWLASTPETKQRLEQIAARLGVIDCSCP